MATIQWEEICNKIVDSQSKVKLFRSKDLSAHDIVMRIMRKDNYLVSFINMDVLDLSIPSLFSKRKRFVQSAPRRLQLFSTLLEWNLRYFIDFMFSYKDKSDKPDNDQFHISHAILNDPSILKKRIFFAAILNTIAAPFVFFFLIIYFIFRYTAVR